MFTMTKMQMLGRSAAASTEGVAVSHLAAVPAIGNKALRPSARRGLLLRRESTFIDPRPATPMVPGPCQPHSLDHGARHTTTPTARTVTAQEPCRHHLRRGMSVGRRPRLDARAESSSITKKGPSVSNIKLPLLRNNAFDGTKRQRRIVTIIVAAALSGSLIAGAAGPVNAAVPHPAQTARISLASSDNTLPAESLTTAARHVHLNDGRFTLDNPGAEKAGVSRTANALVTRLNTLLGRATATANDARDGGGTAHFVPAAAQDTTITILPGITLTINSAGIQLSLTKQAISEVETIVGFGQVVASFVGSILSISGVPLGGQIAAIVASALGLGSAFLKLCTAPDGSATFAITWFGLPSCSGLTLA